MSGDSLRPFPRVVRIEPSGACNLACTHCPTGTVRMPRGIMQPDTWARVTATLARHRDRVNVVVLYHGGEPLLNRNFARMAGEIKRMKVPFVKTVSNGMLLDEAAIAGIVGSGLDAIEISLDGQSAEENDAIRRKGSFAAVARNIKRLIAYKQEQGTLRPEILISSTQFLCDGDDPAAMPAPPAYLLREFGEPGGAIAGCKATWAMCWPHMAVNRDLYQVRRAAAGPAALHRCDHVAHTVTITWKGDVVPCCYDLTSRHVLGNVHVDDLETIWNGPAYQDFRRRIAAGDFPPLCRNCNVVQPPVYLLRQPEGEKVPC
jgi:radical SAM protein with 4Fe4S-binding SPASM domain